MAIVKANAYGHGLAQVSKVLQNAGAAFFGVAFTEEAIKLRETGITAKILIMGYSELYDIEEAIINNISLTVFNYDMAVYISEVAKKILLPAKIHIKIDTGLKRLGFTRDEEAYKNILSIKSLPYIHIEGIFTHFAFSDADFEFTRIQYNRFHGFVSKLDFCIPYIHLSNSAALITHSDFEEDIVRIGRLLYGPTVDFDKFKKDLLQQVMTLKTKIVHINKVFKGESIGYNRTYYADKDMRIATVPMGYADGILRSLSNKAQVMIGKKLASVVGVICMDQLMIDITDIHNASIGSEVIIFGNSSEGGLLSVDSVAKLGGTSGYELMCAVSGRVPRVYI
jgi:alanine racemase